ncbi:hypothetical protein C8C82_4962 [Flavobacterium sp. 81]|nr:hypothetical protein C8C82_4962 [Flavobacterium sp. 81]
MEAKKVKKWKKKLHLCFGSQCDLHFDFFLNHAIILITYATI